MALYPTVRLQLIRNFKMATVLFSSSSSYTRPPTHTSNSAPTQPTTGLRKGAWWGRWDRIPPRLCPQGTRRTPDSNTARAILLSLTLGVPSWRNTRGCSRKTRTQHSYKVLVIERFRPFLIGNLSDTFLPTQTVLYLSVRLIFFKLTIFLGIPNSMKILYKTSLLTDS